MGLADKLRGAKDKATHLLAENSDKIGAGLDKAADLANDKTGGKHADKIANAKAKAKDALDKVTDDGRGDQGTEGDQGDGTTPPAPPA
ncbi:antitoxin [Nocardioides sp. zg-ZUI104]|uniref:antitoxin n=1 Tax=Nocardioides faecalis TaxID=2803858 RepID=UPI001BCAA514|nr:antitoxin [Nocardioides faecalis]MBS4751755.1 antitoxin [Nocardioides faecalis]